MARIPPKTVDTVPVNQIQIKRSMNIPISILRSGNERVEDVKLISLGDTGAGGKFMSKEYAKELNLRHYDLEQSVLPRNVDGTPNKAGSIHQYVEEDFEIEGRTMQLRLLLTDIGEQKVILGLPWFQEYNPDINWKDQTFTWRNPRNTTIEELEEIPTSNWLPPNIRKQP